MQIRRYTHDDRNAWDSFVRQSKNGTFLFERAYMDYHSDRFCDHSLMYSDEKGKLIALLPANEVVAEKEFYSHQGLTYGGFVLHKRVHAEQVLQLFELTAGYLARMGFQRWHYKVSPNIYPRLPAQEDEYALFRMGAELEACNLSCTLPLNGCSEMSVTPDLSRRRRFRDGQMNGMQLLVGGKDMPAEDVLRRFWPIMEQNMMERFGAKPVHTLEEMLSLQRSFPDQIRCYLVTVPGENGAERIDVAGENGAERIDVAGGNGADRIDVAGGNGAERIDVAGEVLFVSQQVAHAQYGHASALGRQLGALDFLYLSLIDHFRNNQPQFEYFDFGTSNEQSGRILNTTLIAQKEGFGARGIACKTYVLKMSRN